jgi:hypothetical protein
MLPEVCAGYGVAALAVSPFLLVAFVGPIPIHRIPIPTGSADLANLVVPTSTTWIGGRSASGVSATFTGAISGQGAYLGIGLLAVAAAFGWKSRRSFEGRFLLAFFLASIVLSLGPELRIAGAGIAPMPQRLLGMLPLFNRALPGRFVVYGVMALSVMVSLWLAQADASRWRAAISIIGIVLLLPAPQAWKWRTTPFIPSFFEDGRYAAVDNDATVLVLARTAALPMIWQAVADLRFRMPVGYTGGFPTTFDTGDAAFGALYKQQCPTLGFDAAADLVDQASVDLVVLVRAGAERVDCWPPPGLAASITWVDGVAVIRLEPRSPT